MKKGKLQTLSFILHKSSQCICYANFPISTRRHKVCYIKNVAQKNDGNSNTMEIDCCIHCGRFSVTSDIFIKIDKKRRYCVRNPKKTLPATKKCYSRCLSILRMLRIAIMQLWLLKTHPKMELHNVKKRFACAIKIMKWNFIDCDRQSCFLFLFRPKAIQNRFGLNVKFEKQVFKTSCRFQTDEVQSISWFIK